MPALDQYVEQVWVNYGPGPVDENRMTHIELGIGDVTNRVRDLELLDLPTVSNGVVTYSRPQRYTGAQASDQATPAGVYPALISGVPGLDLATGSTAWRIDNSGGLLRLLKAGVGTVATLDFAGVFRTKEAIMDNLNVKKTHIKRQPNGFYIYMDGSTFQAGDDLADKVALPLTVVFAGGYSREAAFGAGNAGFLFGANDYITTGATTGDAAGVTDYYGRLSEIHLNAPQSNISVMVGLQSESNIQASGAGSNVDIMMSHKVVGPRVHAGHVDEAVSLWVTAPTVDGSGQADVVEAMRVVGKTVIYGDTVLHGNIDFDTPTSSTATEGIGFAPPTKVQGYLRASVQGTEYRIPFYKS